ncbi:MAG: hypothetical protein ABIQ53_12185 [Terracoccus sp.]
MSYEDWVGARRPTPVRASSSVVKYSWSPTLYAVTFFKGDWEWDHLSASQWRRMGSKKATNAGWIEASDVTKYASRSELILQGEDKSLHKLTFNQ